MSPIRSIPGMRIIASASFFAGGSATFMSGLMIFHSLFISSVDLVLAILFVSIGVVLWEME